MPKSKADYIWAESMATEVLEQFNIDSAPVPVESIAEKLGLQVLLATFSSDDIAGFLQISPDKRIVVNRSHAPTRRAFTIAHECGHFVLHSQELVDNPDIGVLFRRPIGGETDPIEQEANCFAANLLVPERLLARHYEYQPYSEIAALFGVSEEVIKYRLRRTGRE